MRILLTNDDGIEAVGIRALADWAKTLGEIVVCAPKYEQSGRSHAIELHKPFEVTPYDYPGAADAWCVDSTPADCVRFAYDTLPPVDFVLSGMNYGLNMGDDVTYSGTCGAVFEAALSGIPAMAVSCDTGNAEEASSFLPWIWEFICEKNMYALTDILNVNIPRNPSGILITKQGGAFYRDTFRPMGNHFVIADGESQYKGTKDLTLDIDATMNGYITITPLTTSRTNFRAYEELTK